MVKRIFFLNSTLNVGGAEKMVYELLRHINYDKFQIKICCLYGPGSIGEMLMAEGIDVSHSFMRNKYDLIGIYRFLSLLKKSRVDLLYINHGVLDLFWGFICGKMLKVPSIVSVVHTMVNPCPWVRFKSRLINKLIMHRLDKIVVVSKARMDSLIKEYNLMPEKLILIRNSVDMNRFTDFKEYKNGLRQEIGISEDEKVIGMVGRLVYEKAYDIFLTSAHKISKLIPNSKFLIIGDGRERPALEALTLRLGIKKQVIFLGERQDIPQLISLFDVAVLSSRIESFPVALLEYMAASRPIIATNVGGNTEIILNGETGCIVPPEDAEAIAKAVIELLNNRKKAEEMGKAAKKIVEDRFSLKDMIDKMEKFFLDCVEKNH
ncbi:MAG TPA: hypothetical protein DCY56_00760 [Candidatus Omnitrophica bacterium]|nr:hypothetical protein [Candidatus Omnitrophota bacterium]